MKSRVATANFGVVVKNVARLIYGKNCLWFPMTRHECEILSSVEKPQFPPVNVSKNCEWPPRFGNKSLDYSGNDTETSEDFILQVPRGRLGIERPLRRGRGPVQGEKSFSYSCYPAYRRKGSLKSEVSPF